MSPRPARPFANRPARSAAPNLRKEPRQSRARVTVEAIHEAALQVLRDVGHDKLTTTRVALRAGVSVGTLYQYFADKDALIRSLVVAYLGRAEQAMRAVLAEETSLPTLARRFVRRFIAFKLTGSGDEALRGVFMSGTGQAVANQATAAIVVILAARIRAGKPGWTERRVLEVANVWPSLVFGTTTAMLERQPEIIAEPWFAESLERAVLALLKER